MSLRIAAPQPGGFCSLCGVAPGIKWLKCSSLWSHAQTPQMSQDSDVSHCLAASDTCYSITWNTGIMERKNKTFKHIFGCGHVNIECQGGAIEAPGLKRNLLGPIETQRRTLSRSSGLAPGLSVAARSDGTRRLLSGNQERQER